MVLNEQIIDDLVYAARIGDLSEVQEVLKAAPKIQMGDLRDEQGNTPLHMAAANNHLQVVKYLISQTSDKTDLSTLNARGNTALHWSALNGHLDIVIELVNAGIDPLLKNDSGKTALWEAETNGRKEVTEWLFANARLDEDGERQGETEEPVETPHEEVNRLNIGKDG
ncbi:Ankyrin repeat-containing protein [Neolecta irregularis DAH-3]|uniref:Ankyrin repeat-containing protein n=1 Tax=Neolecta irregularis (strain DAH-3) TaxID=1198029 RepID=A0A1U7LGK8_NEOID|nr:Ankyrin repeat-containing protein [Neolecta irregularis DAH-3]|eukprot:OLL21779.1 Ankyrin repeat-containing protein [Neolecta irregularis DAH-3]